MITEKIHLPSLIESMVKIYFADFIHPVVAIDEIQESGSLYGNQVYSGPFQLPQAYSFCEEFIF